MVIKYDKRIGSSAHAWWSLIFDLLASRSSVSSECRLDQGLGAWSYRSADLVALECFEPSSSSGYFSASPSSPGLKSVQPTLRGFLRGTQWSPTWDSWLSPHHTLCAPSQKSALRTINLSIPYADVCSQRKRAREWELEAGAYPRALIPPAAREHEPADRQLDFLFFLVTRLHIFHFLMEFYCCFRMVGVILNAFWGSHFLPNWRSLGSRWKLWLRIGSCIFNCSCKTGGKGSCGLWKSLFGAQSRGCVAAAVENGRPTVHPEL